MGGEVAHSEETVEYGREENRRGTRILLGENEKRSGFHTGFLACGGKLLLFGNASR